MRILISIATLSFVLNSWADEIAGDKFGMGKTNKKSPDMKQGDSANVQKASADKKGEDYIFHSGEDYKPGSDSEAYFGQSAKEAAQ